MTALDVSSLTGDWRNTNENGRIKRIVCTSGSSGSSASLGSSAATSANPPRNPEEPEEPRGTIQVTCPEFGTVDAPVFAFEFDAKQAGAFYALYDRGNQELRLQANVKLGVLVVVTLFRFPDTGSGRSNYFNREFFYRIAP
ncbi:MAG TPA: hypothetical protein VGF28_11745 [Thermoanaerobaculia bacterium]|jgi:hypothetical protein